LHAMILKIQRELGLPELVLESERESGKKIFAEGMVGSRFELKNTG